MSRSDAFKIDHPIDLTVYWDHSVTAGSVTLEIARDEDSPAWKIVKTIDFDPSARYVDVSFDGVDDEITDPVGRVVVSSLTGGALTVVIGPASDEEVMV